MTAKRRCVLVVSADAGDRHVAEVTLLYRGHDVWTASSIPSADALLLDIQLAVGVALVDLGWPDGVEGLTYGARLRQQNPDARLVILLAAWEDLARTPEAAADHLLVKPLVADAIVAAVEW